VHLQEVFAKFLLSYREVLARFYADLRNLYGSFSEDLEELLQKIEGIDMGVLAKVKGMFEESFRAVFWPFRRLFGKFYDSLAQFSTKLPKSSRKFQRIAECSKKDPRSCRRVQKSARNVAQCSKKVPTIPTQPGPSINFENILQRGESSQREKEAIVAAVVEMVCGMCCPRQTE